MKNELILPTQFYVGRNKSANGSRLVNMYAESNPEDSKSPFCLLDVPGLREYLDTTKNTSVQAMYKFNDNLFIFSNGDVLKVDVNNVITVLGSVSSNRRPSLDDNGVEIVAVLDGRGFVITESSVEEITDEDFPNAGSVTSLDGYIIVNKIDTDQYYISDLRNAKVWRALKFASAEEKPDKLIRVYAFNSSLWLFGERTTEVHYNSGNADFPFEPIQGTGNTTRGCIAPFSVIDDNNTLLWLGDDKVVYATTGYKPIRISTHAIESKINDYSVISDAFAFVYYIDGHKFYCLTFPTVKVTWCYDMITNLWHERSSYLTNRWRANCYVRFNGKQLVGDISNGRIYSIESDGKTEGTQPLIREIVTTPAWAGTQRVFFHNIILDAESGLADLSGQGSDPIVEMSYSDNGGLSFSVPRFATLGKRGEYSKGLNWRKCGSSKDRMIKFKISDPVPFRVSGAYATISIGDNFV